MREKTMILNASLQFEWLFPRKTLKRKRKLLRKKKQVERARQPCWLGRRRKDEMKFQSSVPVRRRKKWESWP